MVIPTFPPGVESIIKSLLKKSYCLNKVACASPGHVYTTEASTAPGQEPELQLDFPGQQELLLDMSTPHGPGLHLDMAACTPGACTGLEMSIP
jgi:hypothetical protein